MTPDDPNPQDQARVACPSCAALNRVPAGRLDQNTACGSCGQALFAGETLILDGESFDLHVTPSDLPVAVVFWAGWSTAARHLAREARQAGSRAEPLCRVALVDGEQEQPLIARLGVRALPSVLVYRAGREEGRHEGPIGEGDLLSWLGGVLRKDGQSRTTEAAAQKWETS